LQPAFAFNAPLWYYILRESELQKVRPGAGMQPDAAGGHFLGPVGGQIVAEVLAGVLWNDHTSYIYQDKHWTPTREEQKSGFNPATPLRSIHEMIAWVTGGAMHF
jgi:hypothetical protein